MTEMTQVWLGALRVFVLMLSSVLYALGGRMKKALFRRILGTLALTGGTIGISFITGSFTWWFFLSLPAYFTALSLGYGGDTFSEKFFKRLMCGFVLGASSLTFAAFTGMWLLSTLQIILAVGAHLWLGLFNCSGDAVREEQEISLLGTLLVPFMV